VREQRQRLTSLVKSVCGTCIRTAAEARASERQHLLCSHQGRCQLRAHQGRRRQRVRMRLLLLLCSIQLGRQHAYIRAAAAAAAPSRAVGSSSNLQAQAVQASKQHRSVPASAPWSTHPPRHLNLIPSRAVAGLLHNPYCSTKVKFLLFRVCILFPDFIFIFLKRCCARLL
jgi:hypothetical protein